MRLVEHFPIDFHFPFDFARVPFLMMTRTIYYKALLLQTTKYYSVLPTSTPHYKVLQTTIPYYNVLQSTAAYYKVLLCTTKYYFVLQILQTTTPYYKVLLQYYAVLHILSTRKYCFGTTRYFKAPLRTTKYCSAILFRTTKYNKELQSTAKRYPAPIRLIVATHETSFTLRGATYAMQNTTELRDSCLIVAAHETSVTLSGATGVTLQHHQRLRLPRTMTLMKDPRHT